MKNYNTNSSEDFDRCPFHSNINAGNDIDLIYKRTYSGDWGHWDDLPDNNLQNQSQNNIEESSLPAEELCN